MTENTIAYCNKSLSINASEKFIQSVENELTPFFYLINEAETNKFDNMGMVHIHNKGFNRSDDILFSQPNKVIKVDTSLYKHLASEGTIWQMDNRWAVNIHLTNSLFIFDSNNKKIDVYQNDPDHMLLDVVRAIKGIFTVALEEDGAVQLHSSAVVNESGATLILADMWQGKTTLLLELLEKFNVKQISCDTSMVYENNEGTLSLGGWPSPFSMSHGTMSDYKKLHPYIPEERTSLTYDQLWKEAKKSVLTSKQIIELFETELLEGAQKINTCLFAKFSLDGPVGLRKITDVSEVIEILTIVYLGSRDPIYHNWHRYKVCDDNKIDENIRVTAERLLDECEFYEFCWAPSAESLFKRLSSLASSHKDLGQLLF